ncbi:Glycine receptor subunit alpha-2-like protein [Leptotrombidium deliense]|uniref:Glycine receptor subunit alpha-2-like protein n=1 Tax=Leptotrombidium deliense TaxID=299467 RepID=A0A443RZH2_9ACAR|nr:Glycine receptor subunit alpha-2-like protein [Leptotrombidium deliense]
MKLVLIVCCLIPLSLANIIADIVSKEYDNLLPPQSNDEAVLVNITLALLNFRSVKAHDLTITVDLFVHQYWIDNRLTYPSSDVKGNSITLHGSWSNKLWIPDIVFKNGISVTKQLSWPPVNIISLLESPLNWCARWTLHDIHMTQTCVLLNCQAFPISGQQLN